MPARALIMQMGHWRLQDIWDHNAKVAMHTFRYYSDSIVIFKCLKCEQGAKSLMQRNIARDIEEGIFERLEGTGCNLDCHNQALPGSKIRRFSGGLWISKSLHYHAQVKTLKSRWIILACFTRTWLTTVELHSIFNKSLEEDARTQKCSPGRGT